MSERKHGNYHVLHGAFDGWQVAQYCEDGWLITGIQVPMLESDFEEVGQRIPAPDEPWQSVPVDPSPEMIDAAMCRAGESDAPRGGESWRAMGQVIMFAHEAAPKP